LVEPPILHAVIKNKGRNKYAFIKQINHD
jgi:hypothetical protein